MYKLLLLLAVSFFSHASLVDKQAPSFTLKNHLNKSISLDDFKGKVVVLEWLNHGCPFVKKHYSSENMQKHQDKYTGKGVVWLSIISSAPGKQGHVDAEEAKSEMKDKKSKASMVLLDPTGDVGKKYSAKTTPHMYVINKEGVVVYEGAIDSISSTDESDIAEAENYVAQALDNVLEGKEVKIKKTKPYGCSVKY